MRYVLGADGGGSKITCLAADETGKLLGYGRGGAVNTNYALHREAVSSFTAALAGALEGAGLQGGQIEALSMSAPMAPQIVNRVMEDFGIRNMVRAAEGETPRWAVRFWVDGHVGVTVDAGTGSLARGWSRDGREIGAGGWGATLGDEGSGLWISMKAIVATLQAHDGRIEQTALTRPILDHFGLAKLIDLPDLLSGGFMCREKILEMTGGDYVRSMIDSGQVIGEESRQRDKAQASVGGLIFLEARTHDFLTRCQVAGLCPVVVEVARQGDWKALEILEAAGLELGRLGAAVIRRLGMTEDEFVVVPFGGVFKAGELVERPFRETIGAVAPRARIVHPRFEPEVGAVLLALDAIGVDIDKAVLNRIEESAAGFPVCQR
jgi:N-acetylglucosamine kinase-like BadF-type ATPase